MPLLNTERTRDLLRAADFQALFIELLGWDHHAQHLDIIVDGKTYPLTAIAHKRGMVAFECQIHGAEFPPYPVRRKIDQQVTKNVREHVIIYTDTAKTIQVWQWVKRESGRPTACREYTYHKGQSGESLVQKLEAIKFSLDEEESLTLVDVTGRARTGFDVEKITKKFYDRFKTEHDGFLKFIKGIPDSELHRWYASVMLNRLMFIYFIQKKGFLDSNADYLRVKLGQAKERGKDKLYADFLCPLFFEGFAKKEADRSASMNKLLGKVPYLNGGLFLKHQIEEQHGKQITIADSAFEKIFEFFEQYQWHLDERPLKEGNEINPDVLGYIFEKYINQKQMGAYYTKEDITEYISKSTVIPYLFDAAKQKCKIAFEGDRPSSRHSGLDKPAPAGSKPGESSDSTPVRHSGLDPESRDSDTMTLHPIGRHSGLDPESSDFSLDSTIWKLLQIDPDKYIYDAVKKGVELTLPAEIAVGLNDVSKRTDWNRPAPDEFALPTEIWREVVARRKRYEEVRTKLANGEIRDINDFITYNLNIRQFAQDVIENSEGPELLRAFYHAIEKVTVLDPTCGSGAFLFAALNILEPLYEACLDRMEVFLRELESSGEKHRPEKYSDFKKILEQVEKHPNRKYFVYKSIIVNNLYGVDIMEEAIEICKLRLFLKLVAQVGDANKIEPLPDIDFNIRAGNTLVGFASIDDGRKATESDYLKKAAFQRIEEKAKDIDRLFQLFHRQQTELGGDVTPSAKQELKDRLSELENELNLFLSSEYGINPQKKTTYDKWLKSHHPFHWFLEFYGILAGGGFDVIIGNPPYVELKEISGYKFHGYACIDAGNLYALIIERCFALGKKTGYQGFIVPVSSVSTDRYDSLQKLLVRRPLHYCSFDDRPSRLFDGLEHIRLTIHIIGSASSHPKLTSSRYNKWQSSERITLFDTLAYTEATSKVINGSLPKFYAPVEQCITDKMINQKKRLALYYAKNSSHKVFYSRKVGYFLQVLNFEPTVLDGRGNQRPPSEFKEIVFDNAPHAVCVLGSLNSNLFYWFITVFSDCRHVNKREVDNFLLDIDSLTKGPHFAGIKTLSQELMRDFKKNSENREMRFAHDSLTVQCIIPRKSKLIIDEIDRVLAKHYGFTDEELDFIINYDIKYRMGRDAGNEEE